jgi:hypothetical protein
VGAPKSAITASPMNFDGAGAFEPCARLLVVRAQDRLDVLRVEGLTAPNPTRSAKSTVMTPLSARRPAHRLQRAADLVPELQGLEN